MAREDGHFKQGVSGNPNGRPKGSPTRFRLKTAMEVFEETGFNPIANLVTLALDGQKEETRIKATAELCKYFAPQLKSSEHKVVVASHEEALDALK